MNNFKILKKEKKARLGIIYTNHGEINTPCFFPVATKGTINQIPNYEYDNLNIQGLMCNSLHLYLKPGLDIIKKTKGLHNFINYNKPIMTDSGGFQAYSLREGYPFSSKFIKENKRIKKNEKLVKSNKNSIEFVSPYDGSKHILNPKKSIKIQEILNSDLMMAFDQCSSPLDNYEFTKIQMEKTHRWAKECIENKKSNNSLYGIIQGGQFKDLRIESTNKICEMNFDAIAIGGSFGQKEMVEVLNWITPYLDYKKTIHLLGIGTVIDVLNGVKNGIDSFDCVNFARISNNAYFQIKKESGGNIKNKFRLHLTNARFKNDLGPLDKNCNCFVCKNYSRAFLHHLFKIREPIAFGLLIKHNLCFLLDLFKEIRKNIKENNFENYYNYMISD